jgi:cellulose synthase/poly-beta-1,6-N-acetylglucosamine synthase-like glycosyltransferase
MQYFRKLILVAIISIFILAIKNLELFSLYFVATSSIIFTINFVFKIILFLVYIKSKNNKQNFILTKNLPIYTILLPCYKEKLETLLNLSNCISQLNYPKEKLDVKFIIEEDDLETRSALSKINHNFEVLINQNHFPKTKPNACNYALFKSKGEFVVVFDAEDKPNKNQLLEALNEFEKGGEKIGCIQFLLNFYNTSHNILSKCFSLEYLAWFNAFLPSVQKLGLLIPLGGTSNHFKTKTLIELGGWNAYNVTEDADLGVKLYKNGLETRVVQSYTLEEAPFKLKTWMPQRQRWMKGYLQTFISHIFQSKNLKHFIGLFLLIGASFFSFFLLPITVILSYFIKDLMAPLFPLFIFNFFSGVFYVLMFFYISRKEGFANYNGVQIIMPFYFLLHSIASLLAFWQFFTKPFYWNKTEHGVKP